LEWLLRTSALLHIFTSPHFFLPTKRLSNMAQNTTMRKQVKSASFAGMTPERTIPQTLHTICVVIKEKAPAFMLALSNIGFNISE
jgi:hypothetical protein